MTMHTVHYDIRDFLWVNDDRTFYGDGWDLFDAEGYSKVAFPNGKKQFVIKNYETGNFQRFTFQQEVFDPFGCYRIFESEDGYRCIINMD